MPEPLLHITYYTDPLDAWSCAFEAPWRRLRDELGERLAWRYRMTGLIPDWQRFQDPLNEVSRPAQMAPYWIQVRHMTGAAIDELLWAQDPPASSYPACLAFKAAEMQGAEAGDEYLRLLRIAAFTERRNIARPEVLSELANEMATGSGVVGWDPQRFNADLTGDEARAAFREDLQDAAYREIGRTPALILRRPDGRASMVVGYRPYEALWAAVTYLVPELLPLSSHS